MWISGDLNENDRQIVKVEYKGEAAESEKCFVATSITAATYIQAITQKQKPIGQILVNEYILNNIVDYANGADADASFFKTTKYNVFKINNATIVNFDSIPLSPSACAELIFNITKAKEIIVLSSIHLSMFIPEGSEVNKIITLTNDSAKSSFPPPNTIGGISASILTNAIANNIPFKYHAILEEDSGPLPKTFEVLGNLYPELNVEKIDIPQKAYDIYEFKINDLGLIYS